MSSFALVELTVEYKAFVVSLELIERFYSTFLYPIFCHKTNEAVFTGGGLDCDKIPQTTGGSHMCTTDCHFI